ncbi:hypothetical protein Pen02_60470 [Plantactinospora endophytica]|uniref:Trypsin-co-occurring domain-containing protein n=1 Tax=Plantactinospora endophytica TaxID=673535 RepID=A0ABQ4EA12_9ACTN|nr:hypothetical protein Pen02_60470 [Plantactinospora endophytica]
MLEDIDQPSSASEVLVPLEIDGHTVFLSARASTDRTQPGDEVEIAAKQPELDDALRGVVAFADKVTARLQNSDATRFSVEVACEFAMESGTFVAILGKVSAKSGLKVTIEWEKSGT